MKGAKDGGAHSAGLKGQEEPYCIGDGNEDAFDSAEIAHLAQTGEVCMRQAHTGIKDTAQYTDNGDNKADRLTGLDAAAVDVQEDQISNHGCDYCGTCGDQGVHIGAYCDTDARCAEQRFHQIAESGKESCTSSESFFRIGCRTSGAGDCSCQFCIHECKRDVE